MTAARPYVDRPPDRAATTETATVIARRWELPTPELVRHGMNSLFACGDVVLRIGAATAPAALAHELVVRLADAGIATLTPVEGLTADTGDLAVTAWERVVTTGEPVDWEIVGRMVRRVHRLPLDVVPDGYPVPSPVAFPWWDFDAMLDDVGGLIDEAARVSIGGTLDRCSNWRADVGADAVLCHGDVHPGNVMVTDQGPLIIDWDLTCRANPAWDHAMLSTYTERWGGGSEVYARFSAGYGEPAPDPDLVEALGTLRNVAATLMRVRAGRDDPAAATEAEQRLRYWRGDPDAPVWRAQ